MTLHGLPDQPEADDPRVPHTCSLRNAATNNDWEWKHEPQLMVEIVMSVHLPTLASLKTFEAVARHSSFTRASEELNITQSAVSRQIKWLEDLLQISLFDRIGHRIRLTGDGRDYLQDVAEAIQRIERSTERIQSKRKGCTLTLATPPAFGMRWLIPRLPRFHKRHPEIMVSLITRADVFDFYEEGVDAALHYGHDDWTGVAAVPLGGREIALVMSPLYLSQTGPIDGVDDLRKCTLLQHSRRPSAWKKWTETISASDNLSPSGPSYEHFYMLIQAAVSGLGVALIPRIIIEDELSSSVLVEPFRNDYQADEIYSFIYQENRSNTNIRKMLGWLSDEIRSN